MNVHVSYTQAGRMMAVGSMLGEDTLLLEHLEVREGINELFAIRATVRAQSEKPLVDWDMRNPVGRGRIDPDWTDHGRDQPAPQIEAEGAPIAEPYTASLPQNLGPIPQAWDPRLPLGGTYDQNWIDTIGPNWAPDYDFAYHNSAHPDLICPGHPKGGETIRLDNLIPGGPECRLTLPDHGMLARFVRADGSNKRRAMVLDTVFLDIAAGRKADARVFLLWRVNFEPEVFASAWLFTRSDDEALRRLEAREEQPA